MIRVEIETSTIDKNYDSLGIILVIVFVVFWFVLCGACFVLCLFPAPEYIRSLQARFGVLLKQLHANTKMIISRTSYRDGGFYEEKSTSEQESF